MKVSRVIVPLLVVLSLALPAAAAGPTAVPIEGIALKAEWTVPIDLKALVGRTVTVVLSSGTTYTGTVKEVGDELLRIEAIRGKELSDAFIRHAAIEALEVQVREIKR